MVLNAEGRMSSDVDRTAGEGAVRGEGLRSCVGLSKSDDEGRRVRMELVAGVEGADQIIKRDLRAVQQAVVECRAQVDRKNGSSVQACECTV